MSSKDSSSLSLRSLKARAFTILLGICFNQLFEYFSEVVKIRHVTALISLFLYLEVESLIFHD
jgi:hypothetical protein